MKHIEVVYSDKPWYLCLDSDEVFEMDPRCRYESRGVDRLIKKLEKKKKEGPDSYQKAVLGNWMLDGIMGEAPATVKITRKILSIVESFCIDRSEMFRRYYFDKNNPDPDDHYFSGMLEEFDEGFVQKHSTLAKLVQLLDAAIQLHIQSLYDVTTAAIAERLDGMPPEQILKKFHLPSLDVFSPEQEEEIALGCMDI